MVGPEPDAPTPTGFQSVDRINEMWILVGVDSEGLEGIPLLQLRSGPHLAVCITPNDLPKFRQVADAVAKQLEPGQRLKLVKFSTRDELAEYP